MPDGTLLKLKRAGYSEYGRRTNVWEYTIGKGHSASDEIAHKHPAIFPEKLAQDHILSWSNVGDLVYDPFLGSGTVALMAELNGRNYLGSEINENYCELARERLPKKPSSKFNFKDQENTSPGIGGIRIPFEKLDGLRACSVRNLAQDMPSKPTRITCKACQTPAGDITKH